MSRGNGRRNWVVTAAAVSALLALGVAYSRRVVKRAEERFPPIGEMLELEDGTRLHILQAGERREGRPSLVLIHGSDGVMQEFTETLLPLLAAEHHVVVVDRPGHGWSVPPPGETPRMGLHARALRLGLRRLGVHRPVLVGHSYGAAVSLRLATEHPDEVGGLVLLSPAAYPDWTPLLGVVFGVAGLPLVGRVLTDALVVPLGRPVLAFFSWRAFRPQPVPATHMAFARALYLRPQQARTLFAEYCFLRRDLQAQAPHYPGIKAPTRVLVGDCDPVCPARCQAIPLANAIPGATVRVLPELSHEMQWHAAEEIVAAIDEVADEARGRWRLRGES